MARPRTTVRLFAALYPPPRAADALLARLETCSLPDRRPTARDQVHMTLQFIGDVDVREVDDVVESVERSTSGVAAMELTPTRLITLPRRGPTRLVAAETDAPGALLEIKRRLVTRLARAPRRESADRFLPHLTLCRFRSPTSMPALRESIDEPPFPVSAVRLMRSELRPDGARHHVVAAFELAGT